MNSFFATVLQRPLPEDVLRPRRKKLLSHFSESYVVQSLSNQDPTSELSRTQQEYFLGLFWQHYHRTMPILNEKQVKEQYESFWSEPSVGDCGRRFAALADIILAVAVQLGTNFVPRDAGVHRTTRVIDTQDASVAGLSYFRRCQIAVTDDLEEPSLTTLQCYILSVVYLNNASFPNTAYQLLGLAVRIAYSLGLHKRPPDTLPKAEQELQRRIWWFLCSLDFNHLMEFGGPSTMQVIGDKQYPDDCEEIAKLSGINTFCPVSDITCLSFFNQLSKLYDAARTIYTTFHKKIRELNIAGFTCDVYENAKTLESCAGFFLECLNPLQTWTKHLPAGLQMRRKRNGKPLSLDRIPVDVDPDLPLWLQRQRLFLELFYHKILMDLCRFFIYFSPSTEINTPFTETHATSCVNHAITMTSIIHQVLTETDVINGWYDAYYLQWDATLSMLGFAFAHPLNPLTPTTFKMLDVAVLTFDIFGTKFSAATLAADLTRELKSSAVQLSERNASGSLITASSSVGTVPGLLSPSSSLDTRRNTVSSIDRNPQTQPNASRKTLDSTFSAFEDDLSPVMLSAPGNSTVPASSLADQFMLSINALDSQWSTMSDPNAIAWGSVNHLEFHDGADAGMPMFQAQQRNESESEDMVLVE